MVKVSAAEPPRCLSQQWNGQNQGRTRNAALVVRREYSTNPLQTGRASDVLGGVQGSTGVLGRYWGAQIPYLLVPRGMISVG